MTAAPATPSPTLTRPDQHQFLSPHYDDIPLSCGGTVALLAAAGRAPRISVVFGEEPDPALPLSPFAVAMHEGWGLDAGQVIASRRREEAAAAAKLGATSRTLPFRDAIYRGPAYASDDALFGPPTPAEADLPPRIAAALAGTEPPVPTRRFYAPLAIGGHVDHRHGFDAGLVLARAGHDVWFYEDLPYAIRPNATEQRVGSLPGGVSLAPAAVVDVTAAWDTKIDAIMAYPSQMETVFAYVGSGGSRSAIDGTMRAYAARPAPGALAERFWCLA